MPGPGLLSPLNAILDVEAAAAAGWTVPELARAFLDGGARFIQLRAKELPSGAFLKAAEQLVELGASYGAAVVINDRVDIARLAGAAGVHVGQDDLEPAVAREIMGPSALVGFSTHTLPQVDAALHEAVTYVAIGPVFGTRSKATGYDAIGLDLVAQTAARAGSVPVVAIGGITLDTAPRVIRAGASSVAVIGDLLASGDPQARVAAYLRVLETEGLSGPAAQL